MTHPHDEQRSDDVNAETTSAFRADFRNELRAVPPPDAEPETETQGSPSGVALLVVERGPNAGSRFVLDQPVMSAGRHPNSDIFLDDVTASRRTRSGCSSTSRVIARHRAGTGVLPVIETGRF